MSPSRLCPDCGSPIVEQASPDGRCPRCLLLRGLQSPKAQPPDADATIAMPGDVPSGTQIGPYRILEPAGEGGMGMVFRAEQREPIRRTVALKLIKVGLDTREVVARFESERQALALMDHPNIAKVLDAGATEEGRPYFVMEYVEGVPITEYCEERELDLEERLQLFSRVCEGVQHAHQKGVIHRDIKPTNVLVAEIERRPVPKIIDFGLAKATALYLTEKTLFTAYGQLLGTPEYMSPEQMDLSPAEIDTRSDVYSLGVLLYELLVGCRPFDARRLREAGFDEMRRIIREEEPAKPSTRASSALAESEGPTRYLRRQASTLSRRLRADLDWIVMKALEKDKSRRYDSPSALSADIGRYLADEPVLAGPPSPVYRLQKFIRRHRLGVGVTAGLVLLVLGFSVLVSLQAQRLARERDRAVAINEFLLESLRSASAYEAGRELTTAELLTLTADRIEDWFADEPWLQVRLRSLIGHTYFDLGRYAEADQMLSEAVANRERAYGAAHLGAKTGLFDPEILWSILPGGSTWYDQRRERLWLSPVNSRWGDIDVVTLAHARARTGDIAGAKRAIREQKSFTTGPLYSLMAELARAKGDLDESVRLYRLELAQGIASMEEWHRAATLSRLGSLYLELGLAAEAEEALREVVALEEAILPTPEHARLLAHRNNVAVALFAQGRRTEALELLLPEVEMARALLTHRHPDFATVHRNLSAMNATPDGAASEPFCGSLFHQGEGGPEGLALRVSAMK